MNRQFLKKQKQKIIQAGIWFSSCIFLSSLFTYSLCSFQWINQIDLQVSDALLRLRNRDQKQDDIITLHFKLNKSDRFPVKAEQDAYAKSIEWLLQQQIKVVIVNIPSKWTDKDLLLEDKSKSDELITLFNHPDYKKKIVLVGYTAPLNPDIPSSMPDFVSLLGGIGDFKEDVSSKVTSMQGFAEFDSISSIKFKDINSPARLAHLEGTFVFPYSTKGVQKFKSFAALAVEKYFSSDASIRDLEKIQINYLPRHSFIEKAIEISCKYDSVDSFKNSTTQCHFIKNNISPNEIKNKIVILDVDFQALREDETNSIQVRSPFDWQAHAFDSMPSLEYQANIVYSLLTQSYYQAADNIRVYSISFFIGIIECFIVFFIRPQNRFHILSVIVVCYSLVVIAVFWLNYIFPFSALILSSILTAIAIYLIDKNNQLLKEDERNKRLLAEEEATISQARKLILRIWSDIHDDPLQELRVAMDDIEIVSLSDAEKQPILERLSYAGTQIRKLLDPETIKELSLQSLLRQGLIAGINAYLDSLIQSGKLILPVFRDLRDIQEFEANSAWLDAREDIFRFFREQIANVIAHAQGGDTTATLVQVHLSQTGQKCLLIIENNGKKNRNINHQIHGGLGSKLSKEMADALPDGQWERIERQTGGIIVKLQWTHTF